MPVRNERRRLPVFLKALERQQGIDWNRFVLCLFFDGCTDGSEEIVDAIAERLPFSVFTASCHERREPNAGRARRRAMALGCAQLAEAETGLLLSTDADSAPAPDWVQTARRALTLADVVAGRIQRAGARDATQDRLEGYYNRLHAHRRWIDPVPWEPTPSHHFTGGANMGFRSEAYAALGGFKAHPSGEDARIVDEAARAGLRVRRDPQMLVRTSARRRGRAAAGLASHLNTLDPDGIQVMHPADAAWQYQGHALARAAFQSGSAMALLAAHINKPVNDLHRTLIDAQNAEAFAIRVVPAAPWARSVSLMEAEAALDELQQSKDIAA